MTSTVLTVPSQVPLQTMIHITNLILTVVTVMLLYGTAINSVTKDFSVEVADANNEWTLHHQGQTYNGAPVHRSAYTASAPATTG